MRGRFSPPSGRTRGTRRGGWHTFTGGHWCTATSRQGMWLSAGMATPDTWTWVRVARAASSSASLMASSRSCMVGGGAGEERVVGEDWVGGAHTMGRRSAVSGQGWNEGAWGSVLEGGGAGGERRHGAVGQQEGARPLLLTRRHRWRRRDHAPFLWPEIFLHCDCDSGRVGKKQLVWKETRIENASSSDRELTEKLEPRCRV